MPSQSVGKSLLFSPSKEFFNQPNKHPHLLPLFKKSHAKRAFFEVVDSYTVCMAPFFVVEHALSMATDVAVF